MRPLDFRPLLLAIFAAFVLLAPLRLRAWYIRQFLMALPGMAAAYRRCRAPFLAIADLCDHVLPAFAIFAATRFDFPCRRSAR